MSDPRRGEWSDATQTSSPYPPDTAYPPNTDPAYSGQYPGQYWGPPNPAPYGPGYGALVSHPTQVTHPAQATQQLPAYWQQGAGYPPPPPPPQPPKSPRGLWFVAGAAVLLVAGLLLALVIVSSSSQESTMVAPLPESTTDSPRPTTPPSPTNTTRVPTPTRAPLPLPIPIPTTEPTPGARPPGGTAPSPTGSESVVYAVSGGGRAINITYVDTGGVMQTEFNVALPWSREVSLSAPAKNSASVAIVNVGRDVTCSVAVNGAQVRQRTGRGLTICTGAA